MSFLEIVLLIVAIFIGLALLKYIGRLLIGILKLIGALISGIFKLIGGIFKLIGYLLRKLGKVLLFLALIFFIFKFVSSCNAGDFRKPTARVTDLSIGYLTESDYNGGNFSDDAIAKKANFGSGATQYMVIDLTIKTTLKNEGKETVEVRTYLPENALTINLESAPTGTFEIVSEDEGTAIYTYYAIYPKKGDKKTVRIVLKLDPEMRGTDKFDILIAGTENTKVKGKTHKTVTLRVN